MGKKEDTATVTAFEVATDLEGIHNRLRILVQMAIDECQWTVSSEEDSGDAQERLYVLLNSMRTEVKLLEKAKDNAYRLKEAARETADA